MTNNEQNVGQWATNEWQRDMTDSLPGNVHHMTEALGDLLHNPAVWALAAGVVVDAVARKYMPKFVADVLGTIAFAAVLYGSILLRQNGAAAVRAEAFGMLMAIATALALVAALIGAIKFSRRKNGAR